MYLSFCLESVSYALYKKYNDSVFTSHLATNESSNVNIVRALNSEPVFVYDSCIK